MKTAVKIFTLLWLVAHFILTLLFVMPVNPITVAVQPLLNATIGAYFGQNWSLFAPDPLVSDHALLARCISVAEEGQIVEGGLQTEGWFDLSTEFWLRFQHNRLSAYDRLVRPQSHAIRQYLAGGPTAWAWRKACDAGSEESCKTYGTMLKQHQEYAGEYLKRIGSSFCLATAPDPAVISYVALRVRQRSPIPWSKRHDPEAVGKIEDFELGVYPITRDVKALGLYRVGGAS